jgi:hypothetical protein
MPKDEFVVEDPMELVGAIVPGDENTLDAMATAIVEEYVLLGWDELRLMTLFVNPLFMATHRIYRQRGENYVRELVRTTCAKFRIPPRPEENEIFAPPSGCNDTEATVAGSQDRLKRSPITRSPITLMDGPAPDSGTTFVPLG